VPETNTKDDTQPLRRWRPYAVGAITTAVVATLIAVVVAITCPAQFAYSLIADRLGAIKLGGLSGSIWDGHASSVQVFGAPLGALDWQLQAAPLLHGTATAHLALSGGEITASGDVSRQRSRRPGPAR